MSKMSDYLVNQIGTSADYRARLDQNIPEPEDNTEYVHDATGISDGVGGFLANLLMPGFSTALYRPSVQNFVGGLEGDAGGAANYLGAALKALDEQGRASSLSDDIQNADVGHLGSLGDWFINNGTYWNDRANDVQQQFGTLNRYQNEDILQRLTDTDYLTDSRGLMADVFNGAGSSVPFVVASSLAPEIGIGGALARGAGGLLGRLGMSTAGRAVASDLVQSGANDFARYALTGGPLEAAINAGGIYDDLKNQGLSDSEIFGKMNSMIGEELPMDMLTSGLYGAVLGGNTFSRLGQGGWKRAIGANILNTPADMLGEYVQEMTQQQLQNKYSGKPYGTFWNPTEDEMQAGRAAAMGTLPMGLFGSARGAMHSRRAAMAAEGGGSVTGPEPVTPPAVPDPDVDPVEAAQLTGKNDDVPTADGVDVTELDPQQYTQWYDDKLKTQGINVPDATITVQTPKATGTTGGAKAGAGANVMDAAQDFMGQHMENGANGCVEAVTKIGARYNPFLADELSKGVVNVDTLVADAGDKVIPFDPNNLEAGDVIVYGDNDHVVLADGSGGYVGNSSSQQKVVQGGDYNNMGGLKPTKIIKTGNGVTADTQETANNGGAPAADLSSLPVGSIATAIAQNTGLPSNFIWAQLSHESDGGNSKLAREDHNYGGVKGNDGEYLHFDNDQEFVDYMSNYYPKYREDGIYDAQTADQFAEALQHGGYFTADLGEYEGGMHRYLEQAGLSDSGTAGAPSEKQSTVNTMTQQQFGDMLNEKMIDFAGTNDDTVKAVFNDMSTSKDKALVSLFAPYMQDGAFANTAANREALVGNDGFKKAMSMFLSKHLSDYAPAFENGRISFQQAEDALRPRHQVQAAQTAQAVQATQTPNIKATMSPQAVMQMVNSGLNRAQQQALLKAADTAVHTPQGMANGDEMAFMNRLSQAVTEHDYPTIAQMIPNEAAQALSLSSKTNPPRVKNVMESAPRTVNTVRTPDMKNAMPSQDTQNTSSIVQTASQPLNVAAAPNSPVRPATAEPVNTSVAQTFQDTDAGRMNVPTQANDTTASKNIVAPQEEQHNDTAAPVSQEPQAAPKAAVAPKADVTPLPRPSEQQSEGVRIAQPQQTIDEQNAQTDARIAEIEKTPLAQRKALGQQYLDTLRQNNVSFSEKKLAKSLMNGDPEALEHVQRTYGDLLNTITPAEAAAASQQTTPRTVHAIRAARLNGMMNEIAKGSTFKNASTMQKLAYLMTANSHAGMLRDQGKLDTIHNTIDKVRADAGLPGSGLTDGMTKEQRDSLYYETIKQQLDDEAAIRKEATDEDSDSLRGIDNDIKLLMRELADSRQKVKAARKENTNESTQSESQRTQDEGTKNQDQHAKPEPRKAADTQREAEEGKVSHARNAREEAGRKAVEQLHELYPHAVEGVHKAVEDFRSGKVASVEKAHDNINKAARKFLKTVGDVPMFTNAFKEVSRDGSVYHKFQDEYIKAHREVNAIYEARKQSAEPKSNKVINHYQDSDNKKAADDSGRVVVTGKEQKEGTKNLDSAKVPAMGEPIHGIKGAETTVVTDSGKEIRVRYRVVPASRVITSHDAETMTPNKAYPQELQPRDRQRVSMREQVTTMANELRPADLGAGRNLNQGAPIIRKDGVVLNGNGRAMAIQKATAAGGDKATAYRKYIFEHSKEFGISRPNLSQMRKYMLVREVVDDIDADTMQDIIGSTAGGSRMGASEQAKADAKKIRPRELEYYVDNEQGDLTTAANRDFVAHVLYRIVGKNERNAYTDEHGNVNADGIQRVKRALFSLAYGDDGLISKMAESTDDNIRNVSRGLMSAAPAFARVKLATIDGRAYQYNAGEVISDAVKRLDSLRKEGKPVKDYLNEQSMFSEYQDTDEMRDVLRFLDENKRSGKKIGVFLNDMAKSILEQGSPNQTSLMDGGRATLGEIIKSAERVARDGTTAASLFDNVQEAPAEEQPKTPEKAVSKKTDDSIFGSVEDADKEMLDALGLSEDDLTDDVLTAPDGIKNTAEERERLEKELSAELNKMSAMPMFNPKIYTLGLKLAMTYVKDGINTVKKLVAKLNAKFGDKIGPWAPALAETVRTWPKGVPFDEKKVMAISKAVGARYENGITSLDDMQADMKKLLKGQHDSFAPMIEASYNGIRKFFEAQKGENDHVDDSTSGLAERAGRGSDSDRVGPDDAGGESGRRSGRGVQETERAVQPEGGARVRDRSAAAGGETGNSRVQVEESGDRAGSAGSAHVSRSVRDSYEGSVGHDADRNAADVRPAQDRRDNASPAGTRARAVKPNKSGKRGDLGSIKNDLPMLKPEQQEDVEFIETRVNVNNKPGVMLTNGTGTGKTYSGLGFVKRMYDAGKKNILIVSPSESINDQWIEAADKHFDLSIEKLDSTTDSGKDGGICITTYANLQANRELVNRNWDAVVSDESHTLMQNEKGEETGYLSMLRALTMNPRGAWKRFKLKHRTKEIRALESKVDAKEKEIKDILKPYKDKKKVSSADNAKIKALQKDIEDIEREMDGIFRKMSPGTDKLMQDLKAAYPEEKRPKVLFLSATPFAHDKDVDYAEGYLFNYDDQPNTGAYNQGTPFDRFMMKHFGYRMRTNKLTRPDAEVDSRAMEVQFHDDLVNSGAMHGRQIDVDKDYDRGFILVDGGIGHKIDEGFKFLSDNHAAYGDLQQALMKQFNKSQQKYLIESIKAREVIPLIQEYVKKGKKVVLFHQSMVEHKNIHPFQLKPSGDLSENRELWEQWKAFKSARPDLVNLSLGNIPAPMETLRKELGGHAVFINGKVPKEERAKNIERFNDDNSGMNIIVCQQDAANAGISLHDTTGKHPRVLINIAMPERPSYAMQIEGRIYRVGNASNAVFRYLSTGTDIEKNMFASTIGGRAASVENLAVGNAARGLRESFRDLYQETMDGSWRRRLPGAEGEGTGGKEMDYAVTADLSEYDRAKSFYFAHQKRTSRTKAQEGNDYFATPEPIGYKMVEWLGLKSGEKALEPSAGHGAISRWFPETTERTIVEPSGKLMPLAQMNTPGAKAVHGSFEDFNIVNKFDGIAMNPPYGTGGKTAMEHLQKAFKQLHNGGRVIAIIPEGPAADKRYAKMMDEIADEAVPIADIRLPGVTFSRAGTGVRTHIVVLDRYMNKDAHQAALDNVGMMHDIDLSDIDNVNELFDRMENMTLPDRYEGTTREEVAPTPAVQLDAAKVEGTPDETPNFTADEYEHTKTHEIKFRARPKSYLGDNYRPIQKLAKAHGGYYSSYAKHSFLFEDEDERNAFLQEAEALLSDGKASAKGSVADMVKDITFPETSTLTERETAIQEFGNSMGVKVVFFDGPANLRGFYNKGITFINRSASKSPSWVFWHENLHWLRSNNPELYRQMVDYISGRQEFSPEQLQAYRDAIGRPELTDADTIEEMLADAMPDVHKRVKLFRDMGKENKSLIQRFFGWLRDTMAAFHNAFSQPKYGLSRTQAKAMRDALANIAEDLRDGEGRHIFRTRGADREILTADGRELSYPMPGAKYSVDHASADSTDDYMKMVDRYQNAATPEEKQTALKSLQDMVRKAAEDAGFTDAVPEQTVAYKTRTKAAPRKTVKVYKVFTVSPDGSPTALFIGGTEKLPQGVWLDAQPAYHFKAKNGLYYVPSTKNPYTKGGKTGVTVEIPNEKVRQELIERGFLAEGSKAQKVTALAYRPGWHAGTLPFFPQGGMRPPKGMNTSYKNIHRYNQVVFECELAADKDYTHEAEQQPKARNKDGSLNTKKADLQYLPENGYYYYATNPMTHGHPELGLWAISGSLKINRALTQEECDDILKKQGMEPQPWEGGKMNLEDLGYHGAENDAARKTLAPITYDDDGNVIPLSQRFNSEIDDIRYSADMRDDEAAGSPNRIRRALAKLVDVKTLDNVEVRHAKGKQLDDISGVDMLAKSVRQVARKSPAVQYMYRLGRKALDEQEHLRNFYAHEMKRFNKYVKDPKILKEAAQLLLDGDALGHAYTGDELEAMGVSVEAGRAYNLARKLLADAFKRVNDARMQVTVRTNIVSRNNYAEFLSSHFLKPDDVLKTDMLHDGSLRVTYRGAKVYEKKDVTVSPAEFNNLSKDKDVYITYDVQNNDGTHTIGYTERVKPIHNLEGYMPHFFHKFMVYEKTTGDDGKEILVSLGSANSLKKAADLANKYAAANPKGQFVIRPHSFEYDEDYNNVVVGDKDYTKMMLQITKHTEMTLTEANKFLHDNVGVTKKNRHRFFGNAMHRKGAKGFDQDVQWALTHYLNASARYVAMEHFKPEAISFYERFFGDFNADPKSNTARYIKNYINDMNGVPSWIEEELNKIVDAIPILGPRLSDAFEGRPALALSSSISWFNAVTKLGLGNFASAAINFMQFVNIGTRLNSYAYANMGLKKAVHLSDADRRIIDESGVLDEVNLSSDAGGYTQRRDYGRVRSGFGKVKRGLDYMMIPFTKADTLMREAAILGAYYQGVKEMHMSHEKALAYAKDVNYDANFDYSTAAAPGAMRAGSVLTQQLFQFQKYPIMQFEFFWNNVVHAKDNKQRARFLVPYLLLSGAVGAVPFGGLINALASTLAGIAGGDDDDDLAEEIKAEMMKWAGIDPVKRRIVNTALYGILANANINISERVGMSNAFSGEYYGNKPQSSAGALAQLFGGPLVSTIYNVAQQAANHNPIETIKAVSPSLGNILQAIVGETRTTHHRVGTVYEDAYSRVMHALGFRSVDETNNSFVNSYLYKQQKQEQEDRKDAMDAYIRNPSSANHQRMVDLGIKDSTFKTYKENANKSSKERSQGEKKTKSKKPQTAAKKESSSLKDFTK